MKSFLSISITLLFFFFSINGGNSAPEFLYSVCANTTTYKPNSTYGSNLNSLLSSLSSNATPGTPFINLTAGQGSDKIYGIFLCRGDITDADCQDCVGTATGEAPELCPNRKIAVIWYDECMIRYSNISFFSIMDTEPAVIMWNTQNISEQTRFNSLLDQTNYKLAYQVAYSSSASGEKYATEKANFTEFQTLYTFGQCTPDLSGDDCVKCLRASIKTLPAENQGGRVLQPSCNVRYEIYPFYYADNVTAPPPPSPLPLPLPLPQPPSNRTNIGGKKGNSSTLIIAIVVPLVVAVALLGVFYFCCSSRKRVEKIKVENEIKSEESLQFNLSTVVSATNNFSDDNKIGEGGFGSVYKGKLSNGQEIAVKRLSKNSCQGVGEFKNEIVLVAKLHHRNLVRLLGFCLQGEENILIYEFVPNKSLDLFLFDQNRQAQLDWQVRYKIVGGIARGLLYLHEDSHLKIIHRDLKASNILLDANMSPKISDFGMARIFDVDKTQASTVRIVGTYGYMSPEYAMHGQFSTKSDVFSFGVLLLEIITGKKNSSFYQSERGDDLLSYAWRHWNGGTPLELVDPVLREYFLKNEVMRCIHIALLCVQEDANDRPTMGTVVLMLTSYTITLPLPRQPAFFFHSKMETIREITDENESGAMASEKNSIKSMSCSINEMSITELDPR